MTSRNLTSRSPQIDSNTSSDGDFISSSDNNNNSGGLYNNDYELQSFDESSSSNDNDDKLLRSNLNNLKNSMDNNQSNNNYSGSNQSLINPFASNPNSSTNLNGLLNNSNSNININNNNSNSNTNSLTFDRYPQGLGTRLVSMNSLGSRSSLLPKSVGAAGVVGASNLKNNRISNNGSMYSESSSFSDNSSNPYVDPDFSPFGGYPTSAFPLHIDEKEPDDYLHNPDPIADAEYEKHRHWIDFKTMDKRSLGGFLGVMFLMIGGLALFIILPALTYSGAAYKIQHPNAVSGTEYEVLTDYVYPKLSAIRTNLVDSDTPESAYNRTSKDGDVWDLVFSDEFNAEGRTFYDGDDQFWYAADLNYAATQDLEWYDPDAVTTSQGTANLRMDAFKNHNLYYRSGMLHSWNRLCFTQGFMEVSVKLPNYGNVTGLWPGMWSLGNLGRPGYMATTDGVWPYSYDSCDTGITANQSSADGISYLGGQRLNSCTCQGADHPNQGTGRGAPEIDIVEGAVDTNVGTGVASQSLQIAPMDIWYMPDYNWIEIYNDTVTSMNTYAGGPFQQAISATTTLNPSWYELGEGTRYFQNYAFEYLNDRDTGYCTWYVGEDKTFTVYSQSLAPNGNVDWRYLSQEPMSMILNLGISNNWAYIDWPSIDFPVQMEIDYVRIYQPKNATSLTCDPEDYPTYDYIENHPIAYRDWNITSWDKTGYSTPKNKITGC